MNILLWFLQIAIALHTAVGAVWKFSHSAEQTMPSLKAFPESVWLAMSGVELLCALALVLPVINKPLAFLAPIASVIIALQMSLFILLHLMSNSGNNTSIIYWIVVAMLCSFIAYGRFVIKPH